MATRKRLTSTMRSRIVELYEGGSGIQMIQDETGHGAHVVRRVLREAEVAIRHRLVYDKKEDYFSTLDTPESAYWAGFIFSDGGITQPRTDRIPSRLTVSLARCDRGHLVSFAAALGGGLEVVDYEAVTYGKLRSYSRVVVNSVRMVEDLARWGISLQKSKHGIPPELPPPLDRHFWRGAFDGDGGFDESGPVCLTGNLPTCEAFLRYLTRNGIHGVINKCAPGRGATMQLWRTRVWRRSDVLVLSHLLYTNLDGAPALSRKTVSAQKMIDRVPTQKSWKHLTVADLERLHAEHGGWEKVADALGMTSYTVLYSVKRRLGMSTDYAKSTGRPSARWAHITVACLEGLLAEHGSWVAVAEALGMGSYNTLVRLKRHLGMAQARSLDNEPPRATDVAPAAPDRYPDG